MENELLSKKGLCAAMHKSFFGIKTDNMSSRTKKIALMGMLIALMVVFERVLFIPVGDSSRYSFTFIILFLSGLLLGAIDAAIVAGLADIIGCVLVGYSVFPLITFCVMLAAFVAGLMLFSERSIPKLIIAIVFEQLVCSLLIKTAALAIHFYGGIRNYGKVFSVRIVQFCIMLPLEIVVMLVLYKMLFSRIKKMTSEFIKQNR